MVEAGNFVQQGLIENEQSRSGGYVAEEFPVDRLAAASRIRLACGRLLRVSVVSKTLSINMPR